MRKFIVRSFEFVVLFLVTTILLTTNSELITVHAIVDPLSVPNNKFGIHIIQATPDESSPAASLVNSSGGDWGYMTVLIESNDRNEGKWKEFFNDLRRRHLIPIVRIATKPVGNLWERPYEGEEQAWADFLDTLNWPTKNRYVTIYNEPNHSSEWGGIVDAKSYAEVLNKTITALKNKSEDFFVLNAGLDASAPPRAPLYEDELNFLRQMETSVPGIFNRLDGWVSHSYPNPAFAGSPSAVGRGTIRTYFWEIQQLRSLGVTKNLPIFITETGWKHAEGINYDPSLPTSDVVSRYYVQAFNGAWNSPNIVAVTPFLLSYQEKLFDHFSFKKLDRDSGWYPQFQTILNMPKIAGKPVQINRAKLEKGEVYSSIVAGQIYDISLTFKNIGQSIWDGSTTLTTLQGGAELGIEKVYIPQGTFVEPGSEYTFHFNLKAPNKGTFEVKLNLFNQGKQFDSETLNFITEVKLPVILQVLTKLRLNNNPSGEYILRVSGVIGESSQRLNLAQNGISKELEARYLLPDYTFNFTLEKPFYMPKTITQKVSTGINTLDFGVLNPDILKILLHPITFFKQK